MYVAVLSETIEVERSVGECYRYLKDFSTVYMLPTPVTNVAAAKRLMTLLDTMT